MKTYHLLWLWQSRLLEAKLHGNFLFLYLGGLSLRLVRIYAAGESKRIGSYKNQYLHLYLIYSSNPGATIGISILRLDHTNYNIIYIIENR